MEALRALALLVTALVMWQVISWVDQRFARAWDAGQARRVARSRAAAEAWIARRENLQRPVPLVFWEEGFGLRVILVWACAAVLLAHGHAREGPRETFVFFAGAVCAAYGAWLASVTWLALRAAFLSAAALRETERRLREESEAPS